MRTPRFGTDGLRGLANDELTPEIALALGRAAIRVLGSTTVVVGRDTRRSGPMLSAALIAGMASEGADVLDAGVLPTPGIAAYCAAHQLPGAVVSASHNPFFDNGIKLFAAGGTKLDVPIEQRIEAELAALLEDPDRDPARPQGAEVGEVRSAPEVASEFVEHLVGAVGPGALSSMHIVLDAAHGAASAIAREVFERLGAEIEVIGDAPDGLNINDGVGSTHPEQLAALVVERGAQLGLALDGDADRLIAIDHEGAIVDGDVIMALFAYDLKERGALLGNAVAVTVMSNLGFHRAMHEAGIEVRTVGVGDRNVLLAIDEEGLSLGGEQSGHVIFRSLASTGDGLLTGLLLADLVRRAEKPLAELGAAAMIIYPQVLRSVRVADAKGLDGAEAIWTAVADAEQALGDDGRVLVRASGTEPLVRVMVEAADPQTAQQVTDALVDVVVRTLGSPEDHSGQ